MPEWLVEKFNGSDKTPEKGTLKRRGEGEDSPRKRLRRSSNMTAQDTEPAETKTLLDGGNTDTPDNDEAMTRHECLKDAAR
jgi:hypothetical protein